MRHFLMRLALGLAVLAGCFFTAVAGPFEDGLAAYNRKDYVTAFRLLHPLAQQGDAPSQFYLGGMYAFGRGVPQNEAEAVRWFRAAAEQGDAGAQFFLGVMYEDGRGVLRNEAEAVRWYRAAAEQGNAAAQYNLGVMYAFGRGVAKNDAEAVRWFRAAAEQGNPSAQFDLGVMYANGRGVAKNEAEAVRWFRAAAEQSGKQAQFNLGWMYANGLGVAKNEAEAVRWYRAAAEQGVAQAQAILGVMYSNGHGVAKNEAEAVRWYRAAAEQGYAKAQAILGLAYASGEGVPKNEAEAERWYRAAAEQGHAQAQYNLGRMYAIGRGVPENEAEAYFWVLLAGARSGDLSQQVREDLPKVREHLENRLTGQQRASVQARAARWQPKPDAAIARSEASPSAPPVAVAAVAPQPSPVAVPPASGKRVALVVGNGAYAALGRLRNPVNDARAIGAALGRLGFAVTTVENADRMTLVRVAVDHARRLRGADAGVVFFAGHGMQVRGVNYLMPVDSDPRSEGEVEANAISLNWLMQQLADGGAAANIVILDACRNNPLQVAFRSAARGLTVVGRSPGNMLILYATAPDDVAADGEGVNGLFTAELLRHLDQPGMPVESLFKRVVAGVRQRSGGAQVPWMAGSLEQDFAFRIR